MKFDVDASGPAANYRIRFGGRDAVNIYTSPERNLAVIISSESPLDYIVTGSALMDGITELRQKSGEILKAISDSSAD